MTFFVAARKMSACCFSKMSIGRSRTLCEPHPPTLTPSSFMALQKLERGRTEGWSMGDLEPSSARGTYASRSADVGRSKAT